MYILGGEKEFISHNDIWRSKDGLTWQRVISNMPNRTKFGAVVMNNMMFLWVALKGKVTLKTMFGVLLMA
jgi:hypothetical protein